MRKPSILIVDDEATVRESLRLILADDYDLQIAASGETALTILGTQPVDLVLLDILMPGIDGLEVLSRLQQQAAPPPAIMLTATRTVRTAVTAMKLGAVDYLTKPFDVEELLLVIQRALQSAQLHQEVQALRSEVGQRFHVDNLIGRSRAMQEALRLCASVAQRKTTVLITGESGTGKERIARAVHYQSPRRDRSLVTLNCAAIPDHLLESELFGHERGAFTDAHAKKRGQFELADGGTIFLDEIGEMPASTQAKILRVLELGEFLPVGGDRPVQVDVRIIAATNRNLAEGMRDGSFRSDLYYRLNVVTIHLAPLRERREDLLPLIQHFLATKGEEMGLPGRHFDAAATECLLAYGWPGNVRELENIVERALVLASGETLGLADLPEHFREDLAGAHPVEQCVLRGETRLAEAVDHFEQQLIRRALEQSRFNQTRAAELLGTTRRILKYKMDKLGIPAVPA